ncbi:MAG: TRAP transporter large permease [Hoeflea sp.]|uniref:TRAP transporter large permease n=1 Tax=Hoeflea sp. TaxID=1940281 RepID=UPI001D5EDD2F|nr:TRAP transporter large permease [Hoeflea sp.]MBU4529512.1 TRAP transporter large permease [Alphaproteobacteria bacterium]MBU4546631.1 TRAP transporter large permease [Alphaproteobacteria bacterium]MBU4550899.1 TRAP transporter large permease [Alphaproteobacteria bacterium]MBV1723841.1 TRAP transporter large permease [Hoeflea sp.]MBV1763118.1 TRAP transporter large permease [Hoeflea sp.]
MSITLLVLFGVIALLGVPLSLSLGLSAVITLWYYGLPVAMITQNMATSINSFLLIAVPLFILAGQIMERGGLSERIFDAAEAVVGRFRGGLGYVNIASSFVFGGISGSSVADIASLGPISIRAMTTRGYPLPYSAALTLITATLATLVPPSILMIVAASSSGQSVGAALAGGLGPGILLAVALACYNGYISWRRGYGEVKRQTARHSLGAIGRAVPAVGAPVIILTGMFSGIVTPTEAAGLAVLYTFLVGFLVYREIGFRDLVPLIVHSGRTAGSVLLILMVANAATFIFTVDLLPNKTAGLMSHIASSGFATLLLMGIVFLIVGMLMDIVAAALMLIPVMMPAAVLAGVDPLHFVVFMTACLAVGLASPPVGTCLFAAAQVARIPVERLTLATVPFYILNILVLVAVAAFPEIVLWPARILT